MADHNIPDVDSFLAEVPIFRGLPEEDRGRVAGASEQKRYYADQKIFAEGDAGDTMFVVLRGRVRIEREAADGEVLTLATLGAGDHFGEMALFGDVSRSATARAAEPNTTLLALTREHFTDLIRANAEIALHMLAELSRRLRDLNDRMVEVDHTARLRAPTLAETIVNEYPHPIALVYQEMDRASDSVTKLRRMLELFEVIVGYQCALFTNCYLQSESHAPEVDADLLRGQASPTLGYRRHLIQTIAGHFETTNATGLAAALRAWFEARHEKTRLISYIDETIGLRNSIKHGSEASLDERACDGFLEQFLPKTIGLLESIDFLRAYPLVSLQGMQFSRGSFHYTYQLAMGAFRSFRTESFTHKTPLETQQLYVLDPAAQAAWSLSPWMGLYRCETCGDRDVFMTQTWIPARLTCVEFGRGHRCSPADLKETAAALASELEERVRGTEYEVKRPAKG